MDHPITLIEANSFLRQLAGMPVSLPWQGHGSAIFLELGKLEEVSSRRHVYQQGEANVRIEWNWRVELANEILFGSSNSRPAIGRGIAKLQDLRLEEIAVQGDVVEIALRLSNGNRLISCAMLSGDPAWGVRLPDGRHMSCCDGQVRIGTGQPPELSTEAEAAFDHADATTLRWGKPLAEPVAGPCRACQYFLYIDGDAAFTDYGVCTSAASPLDGRVVEVTSGCPQFQPR